MIQSVPIWVKLSRVPKDPWNPKGFSFLASTIGKPLFTDKATETGTMLSFARVCVEVEPTKDLPFSIPINPEQSVDIEYPWRPLICSKCMIFGHATTNCTPLKPINNPNLWKPVNQRKNGPKATNTPAINSHPLLPTPLAEANLVIEEGLSEVVSINLVPVMTIPSPPITITANLFASLPQVETPPVNEIVETCDELFEKPVLDDGTEHTLNHKKNDNKGKNKQSVSETTETSSSSRSNDNRKQKKSRKKNKHQFPDSEPPNGGKEKGGRQQPSTHKYL
ncbi:hypothetical protein FRX31_016398 [Thalictrum thalictroides]|uniref:DUF4283 domain-containing protein n=1 Tax=Thalictrum thalictroides TaxID=46969 RepID=A0A7J6W9A8_THATH|nr:hypothetical protein FRX31_016398 [Thalictrum thalictroides]